MFSVAGDLIAPEGASGLFWTRQNLDANRDGVQDIFNATPEWTASSFEQPVDIVNHLFMTDPDSAYRSKEIFISTAAHCVNVQIDTDITQVAVCIDDEGLERAVANDDADFDI